MATARETIDAVLAGRIAFDEVDDHGQAVVRAAWDEQIAKRIAGLDFTERLDASGAPWAEADDDGDVVVRGHRASIG